MRDLLVNIELVYFIYVRKSTDVEDKQILSVAAQIIELKEFAKRMGLRIAGIIVEKQTAKKLPPSDLVNASSIRKKAKQALNLTFIERLMD